MGFFTLQKGFLKKRNENLNLFKDKLQLAVKEQMDTLPSFVQFVIAGDNLKEVFHKWGGCLNLFESWWKLGTSLPSELQRGQETGTLDVNVPDVPRIKGSTNFLQGNLSSLSENDCIALYLSTAVFISPSNLVFLVSLEMGNKVESLFLFPCLRSDLEYNTLFLQSIEIGCLHLSASNCHYEMSCVGSAHDGSYRVHSWIIIDKYGHCLSRRKLSEKSLKPWWWLSSDSQRSVSVIE